MCRTLKRGPAPASDPVNRHAYADAKAASAAAREAAEAAAAEQARLQGELAAVHAQLEAAAAEPGDGQEGPARHDAETALLLQQLQARPVVCVIIVSP